MDWSAGWAALGAGFPGGHHPLAWLQIWHQCSALLVHQAWSWHQWGLSALLVHSAALSLGIFCLLGCSVGWLASLLCWVVVQLGICSVWVYLMGWMLLAGYIHDYYGQTRT